MTRKRAPKGGPTLLKFDSFLGNSRIVEILRRAMSRSRLPHSMIFAGPAGVGKRTLALLVAQSLNCLAVAGEKPCGACNSCRKILTDNHPDVRQIMPDGSYIHIDQIRAIIQEIAFRPFEGRYRIVILDGGEKMRTEAANSLLKTLEEPPSETFLILVTTNPFALLGTIRSRCRILHFGGVPEEQIEQHLVEGYGWDSKEARLAALFSNGSLQSAISFDAEQFQGLRQVALKFVSQLLVGRGFAEVNRLSQAVAKNKEAFQPWIDLVSALLKDVYCLHVAPEQIRQADIVDDLIKLERKTSPAEVVAAIKAIKKLKHYILCNVKPQVALESLYLELRLAPH